MSIARYLSSLDKREFMEAIPSLTASESRITGNCFGFRLAVDAYGWLHRGAYGCAPDLVKGVPTTRSPTTLCLLKNHTPRSYHTSFIIRYVDYAMHRVRLLKHHNIKPYIVFDGGPLPAKKGTESSRLKSREENRERGLALSAQGRHSEARECFVKAVDVTPEMAYQLIKVRVQLQHHTNISF